VAGQMIELGENYANKRKEEQFFYSELLHIAKEKGYIANWAKHKYKEKFGAWPVNLYQTTRIPSLTTINWVKYRQIAWAKSKYKKAA
jgi:ribosomal protein S8